MHMHTSYMQTHTGTNTHGYTHTGTHTCTHKYGHTSTREYTHTGTHTNRCTHPKYPHTETNTNTSGKNLHDYLQHKILFPLTHCISIERDITIIATII